MGKSSSDIETVKKVFSLSSFSLSVGELNLTKSHHRSIIDFTNVSI